MSYFGTFEKLCITLLEDVDLKAVAPKTIRFQNEETGEIEVEDISNFIFAHTNGGTEPVTLYGIRTNDSKSDPSKKAGDEMVINGRLKFKYTPTGTPSPLGNAQERYKKYDTITLLVKSVDGEPYPDGSIRHIKVNTLHKIVMGRETYNILR